MFKANTANFGSQSDPSKDKALENKVAVARTTGMAPSLEEIEEVPHSEIFAAADSPKIKLSPRAPQFDAEQAPILAMHWLNTPLTDGLLTVNWIYQKIKKAVIAYQLDHNDAFYEQYPTLLILDENEEGRREMMTTSELRQTHRKYDRRLAHLIWHYYNALCMYVGSVANMCLLGHINGPGQFNDFGEAFKIGRINNATNRYAAFFKPQWLEDYIVKYSKLATGSTVYGADIVSIGLWITDCKGNRGGNTINFKDFFGAANADGTDIQEFNSASADWKDLMSLFRNMEIVRKQFVRDDVALESQDDEHGSSEKMIHANYIANILNPLETTDESKIKRATPSMPRIENGAVVSLGSTSTFAHDMVMYENFDTDPVYKGLVNVRVGDGSTISSDNIINRVWDNYTFWREYLETYFNEFSQPTSELVHFCIEMGFLDKSTHNGSWMFTNINTKECFDMLSLRDHMVYKRDNKCTTATQIKWMPIIDNYLHDWKAYNGQDVLTFDQNFNRYPVDLDDPVEIVRQSRKYPGLTPEIFHEVITDPEGRFEPFVANSINSGSTQIFTTPSAGESSFAPRYPLHGILGKYASYLDYASSSHMDAEHTAISTVAIDSEVIKSYIKSGDGLVLKETMASPKVYHQPLIDCTDPYQCGFNVIHFFKSKSQTEFERWFYQESNFDAQDGDPDSKSKSTPVSGSSGPVVPAFSLNGDGKYELISTLNTLWLASQRYSVMFVGDAIWYQPETTSMMSGAGYLTEEYQTGSANPAASKFNTMLRTMQNDMATVNSGNPLFWVKPETTSDANMVHLMAKSFGRSLALSKKTREANCLSCLAVHDFFATQASGDGQYGANIDFHAFSPMYGPVNIVKYDVPDIGSIPVATLIKARAQAWTANNPELKVGYCKMGDAYSAGANGASAVIDSYRSVAQFLLWCIDNIRFKKTYRVGRRLYVPDEFVEFSGFSGAAKIAYALLSRAQVMYTGIEDTVYLNSIPEERLQVEKYDIRSGNTILYGAQVKAPVVTTRRIPEKHTFTSRKVSRSMHTAQAGSQPGKPYTKGDYMKEQVIPGSDKSWGVQDSHPTPNPGKMKGKNRDRKKDNFIDDKTTKDSETSKDVVQELSQNSNDSNS